MIMDIQFGATGMLMMLIVALALVIPFWKLLPRFGYSAWIAVFATIPLGALVLLWLMAFTDRPVTGAK